MRQFGHTQGVTFQHYLSRSAPCDVQNILNGKQPDQERINFFRSMRSKVDRDAPKPLHSSLYEPRFRTATELAREPSAASHYRSQRKEYFDQVEHEDELSVGCATHHTINEVLPRGAPSPLFQNMLRYDIDRTRIINALYGGGGRDIYRAIDAVARFLRPTEWSYPSDKGAPGSEFCYICANVVYTSDSWKNHCREHVQNCDMHCGPRSKNGILLAPGICPFCLGCEDLDAEHRLHQWGSLFHLLRHLETHVCKVAWPLACAHPRCDVTVRDAQGFWEHMSSDHGLSAKRMCKAKTANAEPLATDAEQTKAPDLSPQQGLGLTCATCQQTLNTLEGFFKHTKTHHEFRRCPQDGCTETFREMGAYRHHLYQHCGLSTYVCCLKSLDPRDRGAPCGKIFGSAVNLRSHRESHARQEKLRCPVASCSLIFRKESTLERHKNMAHRGDGQRGKTPDATYLSAKRGSLDDGNHTSRKRPRRIGQLHEHLPHGIR